MTTILLDNKPLNSFHGIVDKANRFRDCQCLIWCLANQDILRSELLLITQATTRLQDCLANKHQDECEEFFDEEVEDMDQY